MRLFNEKSYDSSLVFVRTKSKARRLSKMLVQKGYNATSLHGDLNQRQRDVVMDKYRKGRVNILVATDVASRGLDVYNIDAVVNYDIPEDSDSYVHRIGRTGRANQTGEAYTLLDPSERKKMHRIIHSTNTEVQSIMLQDPTDMETDAKKIQSGSKTAYPNKRSRPRRRHRKKKQANK